MLTAIHNWPGFTSWRQRVSKPLQKPLRTFGHIIRNTPMLGKPVIAILVDNHNVNSLSWSEELERFELHPVIGVSPTQSSWC